MSSLTANIIYIYSFICRYFCCFLLNNKILFSVSLSFSLSLSISNTPSLSFSLCLYFYLSIYLCLSVSLSLCLSFSLSLSPSLSLSLYIILKILGKAFHVLFPSTRVNSSLFKSAFLISTQKCTSIWSAITRDYGGRSGLIWDILTFLTLV